MDSSAINARTRRGRIQMLLLLLAGASPVIASYFAYYVIKPEGGKTNFGTLVYPAQEFNTDGKSVDPELAKAYDEKTAGLKVVSLPADPKSRAEFDAWLNKEGAGKEIQLIDPSPAKMMYFPITTSPKEFSSMKKDLEKLLKLNHKGERL